MQVIISTRGMTISKSYKDALTQKLSKLEPMLPKVIETKAVLSKEKHRRTAALTLIAKNHTFRSAETAGDLAVAVDMAVDALARQVRELKDRLKNRKGRGARRVPVADGPAVSAPPAVVVRQIPLKPMSLDEAMAELGSERDDFLVFANASTDAVNVLYRRKDGGLGLIEPLA
ncbi:MAG TPA: ribosome-associated translation inhibitor RaiA [Methylomirabilota bacterium]|jgi:putative sigma-54 modulation protein|nr:ribosome-associated translation inhibitor RaiA [Methylomirabilota bacterium]